MILATTLRRVSPWVVGLFIIAQIFAIVPLISEHTAHVAQSELGISLDRVSTGNVPHGHFRGDSDGSVQHHELQDLSGAFICAVGQCAIGFARVAVSPFAQDALVEGDPIFLELPPKALLSA